MKFMKFIFAGILFGLIGPVHAQYQPEPNPPIYENPEVIQALTSNGIILNAVPTMEWISHKSADGIHPDGNEQKMMWLMNRARQDPTTEGIWLGDSTDPDIKDGRDLFNVDIALLKSQFAALPARAPAAFDVRLYNASRDHSLDLIARDAQDHTGQIDKINATGYLWSAIRLSVFSNANSALNNHAALNIDWGGDASTGGMQDPPGHRYAIMDDSTGFTGSVTMSTVGIAMVADNVTSNSVGPLVFSGAYVEGSGGENNRFIVGTVWSDLNQNQYYDAGEGIGGVTVMPDSGTYYAITGDAGGYALPVTIAGNYTVTFSGSGLANNVVQLISVGTDSVLLDVLEPLIDTDGDTVADNFDNCPNDANLNQLDTDSDGLGDVCDLDDDNDSFTDILEVKYGSNPLDNSSLPQAFDDIVPGDPYYPATLGLDDIGVVSDCDGSGNFCPNQLIQRDTAAIWLIKAAKGSAYVPATATGLIFADIATSTLGSDYIEDLSLSGGTEGCDAATPLPNYCSQQGLTKDQAAKMLMKTKNGLGYSPTDASGAIFNDVSAGIFAADFIEELQGIGATEGCDTNTPLPNYCPGEVLSRGGFARMLAKTFGLMP